MTALTWRAVAAASVVVGLLATGRGAAAQNDQPFADWLAALRQEALAKGIGEGTLGQALDGAAPIPRVLELDRRQPEFTLQLADYLRRVASPSRIDAGRGRLAAHRAVLAEIGRKYGVQPRFIVALWGIETDFGRVTGGFPVVPALATLAYDGRRSAYFRKELLDSLTILDQGHITPSRMIGSWAGAMGQSQFMPSSFLKFAEDYDGDGRRDIWTTLPDVFASTANYLAKTGWNPDQSWGRRVRAPKTLDAALASLDVRKSLTEWRSLGILRGDGGPLPDRSDVMASLLLPEGASGPAFLVYDNFRTILKWNKSNAFAIGVGFLADGFDRK